MVYKFSLKMLFSFVLFITVEFISVWVTWSLCFGIFSRSKSNWKGENGRRRGHCCSSSREQRLSPEKMLWRLHCTAAQPKSNFWFGVRTFPFSVRIRIMAQRSQTLAAPGGFSASRFRCSWAPAGRNDRRLINMCETERSCLDHNKNAKERAETFKLSLKNNNARCFFRCFGCKTSHSHRLSILCLLFGRFSAITIAGLVYVSPKQPANQAAEALAVCSPVSFRLLARNNV